MLARVSGGAIVIGVALAREVAPCHPAGFRVREGGATAFLHGVMLIAIE